MLSVRNIIAACTALLLFACSGTDQDSVVDQSATSVVDQSATSVTTPTTDSTPSTALASDQIWVEVSASNEKRPSISVLPNEGMPKTLVIEDVNAGTGEHAVPGDLLEVQYVGALLSDGTEFDASWNRGQTFFVPIGVGAVIPGWDQGIVGMREGGRRLLIIPPELAYGSSGAVSAIPPNAFLVFVVDLVAIVDLEPPTIPDSIEVGTSLEVEDLSNGTGDIVEAGDTVTVHYLGTLTDGTVFDASWRRGTPFTTTIGVGMVIQGWDQGIVGMREGGRRLLKIPSDLAYGEQGSGGGIPPNTPLLFVVDLLRIQG